MDSIWEGSLGACNIRYRHKFTLVYAVCFSATDSILIWNHARTLEQSQRKSLSVPVVCWSVRGKSRRGSVLSTVSRQALKQAGKHKMRRLWSRETLPLQLSASKASIFMPGRSDYRLLFNCASTRCWIFCIAVDLKLSFTLTQTLVGSCMSSMHYIQSGITAWHLQLCLIILTGKQWFRYHLKHSLTIQRHWFTATQILHTVVITVMFWYCLWSAFNVFTFSNISIYYSSFYW